MTLPTPYVVTLLVVLLLLVLEVRAWLNRIKEEDKWPNTPK